MTACAGEDVLPIEALLPAEAPSSAPGSWRHPCRGRNVHLRVCRDGVQLSVHSQRLAPLHVALDRLLVARHKTATQRCDRFSLRVFPFLVTSSLLLTHRFPNLGVNYPNWVMGPFDVGNGLFFFLLVF